MYICTVSHNVGDDDDPVTVGETLTEAGRRMAAILHEKLEWIVEYCHFYKVGEKLAPHLEQTIVE